MGNRIEAQRTQVTFSEVAAALEASWLTLLGSRPSRESLAVLLAQSALETGHWKHSYCFNLGNAKATATWSGDYCYYPADEIVSEAQAHQAFLERQPRTDGVAGHDVELLPLKNGQVQVTLHPDHPWCRFRAFTSLAEGAQDYLELLRARFARAWPAIEAGDPVAFVHTLKELRYFTASVDRYLPPVQQLFGSFLQKLVDTAAAEPAPLPSPLPRSSAGRPTLRVGSRSAAVLEVKSILRSLGYENVTGGDLFDDALLQVVELFQLQHVDEQGRPLGSDGVIGKNTWWALLNPSGDAQKNHLPSPPSTGLTEKRRKLLEVLDSEHRKPVFESPDGSNHSKDIARYWGATGMSKLPWCCAFVSWALREALGTLPIGGKHHLGVQVMWVEARKLGMEVSEPKPGDVFIQIKSGGTGHTGFVVGVSGDGNTVYTCEGNCGNRLKYGQRSRATIHHFIDCIRDDQGPNFPRAEDLLFEHLDGQTTT